MAKAFIFLGLRLTDQDWWWEGGMGSFYTKTGEKGKSCSQKGKSGSRRVKLALGVKGGADQLNTG